MLLGLAGAALGQSSIRGTVAEANGTPVIGATVLVKGTQNATPTDVQGKYELKVAPGSYEVVFSSVGYAAQTLPVTVGTEPVTLNARLQTDAQELNDVVVVGYGSRRVEDITGAVANIKAENTNIGGASTSVDQLIGGRVAGVQFKENTSQPGGGGKTIIRGRNSLFLNTDPLYVIDGFIFNNPPAPTGDASFSAPDRNPLNTINPNDIESVAVLKDAAATAIYGAKGSNGVIIITTKRGTTNRVKVSYDGYGGVQSIAKRYQTLSGPQYMQFWNEQSLANGKAPLFTDQQVSQASTTDWFKEVTRTGSLQSHNLSLSGKTDNLNYYFSAGYYDQLGVIKNTGLERFSGRSNIEYHKDKFRFATNVFATRLNDTNQPTQGGVRSSVISSAIAFAPYLPVRSGEQNTYTTDPLNSFIANPVSLLDIHDKLATDKLNFSVSADYEVLPGLRPELRLTYDVQNANRYFYVPPTTEYNGSLAHGGTGSQTAQRSTGVTLNGLLHYDKALGNKSNLQALLGYEYYYRDVNQFQSANANFGTNATGAYNLGGGANPQAFSNRFDRTDISVFGRVDYILNERYLATVTLRGDGSSVFGANNKTAFFPGASVGWRLDKEEFLQGSRFELLKLRVGYGQTGNSGLVPYQSLTKYTLNTNGVIGQVPVVGATLDSYKGNPDIKWEKTTQTNVGLDYALTGGRVSGAVDFFLKNTSDMLVQVAQPSLSGYQLQWRNAATLRGWGAEFSINTLNVQANRFQWNSSFNFSYLNNKITEYNLTDATTIAALNSIGIIKGERTNSYYTYEFNGVDPKTGSATYRDLNGDGKIDTNDRRIVGNPDPRYILGLGNGLKYGGLSLDFFFTASLGQQLYNQALAQYTVPNVADITNRASTALGVYSAANPGSTIPNNGANGGGSFLYNSRWIENAGFLRLQRTSLGYTFAPAMLGKAFTSARVYVQAQNLFVVTKYSGLDPEAANNAYIAAGENVPALLPGSVDINAYPPARTFTFGINLTL